MEEPRHRCKQPNVKRRLARRAPGAGRDRASFARSTSSDNVKLMFMRRDQPLNWLVSKKRKAF